MTSTEREGSGTTEVVDSPSGWVRQHIEDYVSTGGEKGHQWRGVTTLLLTTTGRRTGTRHRTALIYDRDGDDYLIVASKGGAPHDPAWYLNLTANPDVELQVGAEVFAATAETLHGDERARAWKQMVALFPQYADYERKTDREIPVVRLRRA
jgi:deazaflavin-dependent oxidoreductase (nitroreductase family)